MDSILIRNLHCRFKKISSILPFDTIPYVIIVITSIWTFIHTHSFLKRRHTQNMVACTTEEKEMFERSVYSHKVCNLMKYLESLTITKYSIYNMATLSN